MLLLFLMLAVAYILGVHKGTKLLADRLSYLLGRAMEHDIKSNDIVMGMMMTLLMILENNIYDTYRMLITKPDRQCLFGRDKKEIKEERKEE